MKNLGDWFISQAKKLPSYTIVIDGVDYLTRYYVFLKDRKYGNIFIHHFLASDQDDGFLHSHPFLFSLSFVYRGGYKETRRVGEDIITKVVKPGMFNFIMSTDFHSVELLDEEVGSWSIFITGPRKTSYPQWQFWNPTTKETKPWDANPGAIE